MRSFTVRFLSIPLICALLLLTACGPSGSGSHPDITGSWVLVKYLSFDGEVQTFDADSPADRTTYTFSGTDLAVDQNGENTGSAPYEWTARASIAAHFKNDVSYDVSIGPNGELILRIAEIGDVLTLVRYED